MAERDDNDQNARAPHGRTYVGGTYAVALHRTGAYVPSRTPRGHLRVGLDMLLAL